MMNTQIVLDILKDKLDNIYSFIKSSDAIHDNIIMNLPLPPPFTFLEEFKKDLPKRMLKMIDSVIINKTLYKNKNNLSNFFDRLCVIYSHKYKMCPVSYECRFYMAKALYDNYNGNKTMIVMDNLYSGKISKWGDGDDFHKKSLDIYTENRNFYFNNYGLFYMDPHKMENKFIYNKIQNKYSKYNNYMNNIIVSSCSTCDCYMKEQHKYTDHDVTDDKKIIILFS